MVENVSGDWKDKLENFSKRIQKGENMTWLVLAKPLASRWVWGRCLVKRREPQGSTGGKHDNPVRG